MAGVTVEQEIEKLKSMAKCKIIKNVGDFIYLIDATLPETDVLVKLQVTAQYPEVKPGVFVRHPTMTKDEVQKMLSTIPDGNTKLLDLFPFIQSYILENHPVAMASPKKQTSPRSNHVDKRKTDKSEDNASSKKPSMRTAADVIKRIQWDSSLQSEAFIVGYVDRFLGIQEQPFNAFNWVNPAEADWMDLNIPEHRIEYFKYNDSMVWEKKSRLDNVFGSTGGMTIDQFLSQNETEGRATEDVENEASQPEAKAPQLVKPQKKQTARSRRPQPKEEQMDRPNHFIAIPITNSHAQDTVQNIQEEYLTLSESDGENRKKELYNLHITLCAVRINNQNDLDAVTEILYQLIMENKFQEEFKLGGLGTFWGRVLFAGAELDSAFTSFVLQLRKLLVERDIRIFDNVDEFKPHVTLFSFPRSQSIHFPIEDFIAIKSDQQTNDLASVVLPLQNVVIYSMERDDANRYIEKLTLDVHT